MANVDLQAAAGGMSLAEVGSALESAKRQNGTGVVIFGDSITYQNQYYPTATELRWSSRGYFGVANFRMGWPFDLLNNAGVSGDRTDQMLARITTDVIAYDPDIVVVFGGVNDLINSRAAALIIADLQSIYDQLLARGITVIACTIPIVSGASDADTQTVNQWMHEYAITNSIDVADFASAYIDVDNAVSPYMKTGFSGDNIHPGRYGGSLLADELVPVLQRYAGKRTAFSLRNSSPNNINANTLNTGSAGSVPNGTAPDGWSFYTGSVDPDHTFTGSKINNGSYYTYRVALTNAGSSTAEASVYRSASTVTPNANYRISIEFGYTAVNLVNCTFSLRFRQGSTVNKSLSLLARDYVENVVSYDESGTMIADIQAPAVCDNVVIQFDVGGETFTLDIGRIQIINLDA